MIPGFFPPLDPSSVLALRSALSQMRRHRGWLDQVECPYDGAVRAGLNELNKGIPAVAAPVSDEAEAGTDNWLTLERDTRQMLQDLQLFMRANPEIDPKERMNFFRTGTSLMEKLVGLSERALNLKSVSQFQRAVMTVFEQVLDPTQRSTAIKMLEDQS